MAAVGQSIAWNLETQPYECILDVPDFLSFKPLSSIEYVAWIFWNIQTKFYVQKVEDRSANEA